MKEILVAVITAVGVVLGQWMVNRKTQAKREQKLDDKIDLLTKKVDEHNGYAKLFADMTTEIKVMAQDIKYIKEGRFSNDNAK